MRSAVFAAVVSVPPSMVSHCSGSSNSETDTSETSAAPACTAYDSGSADYAPIQTTGSGQPTGASSTTWATPADWTYWVPFDGTVGSAAVHEGMDYVHDDSSEAEVDVAVAASGDVVYVRTGCPESALFSPKSSVRECGSGWGNHVVVHHGGTTYTRYAHLSDGEVFVEVGDQLRRGDVLGLMGNSGRSETRHLHFELGSTSDTIDPCAGSWSFSYVYDPAVLGL